MQINTYINVNTIPIRSQKLAGYLMLRGFVLKRLEPNIIENTNRNIFIFNNTQELTNAINDYKKTKEKSNP